MFEKLMVAIGLRNDVGAPVHAGVNPVYFTNVYSSEDDSGWTFSWRSADHKQGCVREGFNTREEANVVRRLWTEGREQTDRATFVHEDQ